MGHFSGPTTEARATPSRRRTKTRRVKATFLTRGAGASRLLVAGGVFWCAAAAHAKAKEIATRALQKFGERVLEPTEAELRR